MLLKRISGMSTSRQQIKKNQNKSIRWVSIKTRYKSYWMALQIITQK